MQWVALTIALIGLFWYGYRHPYRRRWLLPRRTLPQLITSAVDRQHRHLLAGGRVGETAVAATATRLGELLRTGRAADVERELRPGVGYAVQIRALTAIGTPEAGRVLQRQLVRTLSRDPIEQTWYWADVVAGLRLLRHLPALPDVLRCTDAAFGLPAAPVLAAEAVAFPNFATALNDLSSPLGQAALRAVVAVARGCRKGVIGPGSAIQSGLGDLLAMLSETAPQLPNPWLVAAVMEAERLSRRTRYWSRLQEPDARRGMEPLGERLHNSRVRRVAWLAASPGSLLSRFPVARPDEQNEILRVAYEFRADVTHLFPHLPDMWAPWWSNAIRCLTWSRSPIAGPLLAAQASRSLNSRRSQQRAPDFLCALRGHACSESEQALIKGSTSNDPRAREAAILSLGWWPPFDPASVMRVLRKLRGDSDEPIRRATVFALARLGDRAAIREITAGLHSEEFSIRATTATRIASEEVSWLWPSLQELAETGEPQTAFVCAEATEQIRENVLGLLG